MAREHGRILTSIWSDEDFRRLTPGAQHLYLLLVTSATLNYCGVADWRPNRLRPLAADWTIEAFEASRDELIRHLYIVVDEDSEEALVRSFIRNDGLMKQRHMGVSMAKAYSAVASARLRGVITHELIRLHRDDPELKGWNSDQVRKLLGGTPIDASAHLGSHPRIQERIEDEVHPPVEPQSHPPIQYEMRDEVHPPAQPPRTPSPSPSPSPTPNSGYLSEYVTEADASEKNPPPIRCATHIDNPTTAACRACGEARAALANWEIRQQRRASEARSAEIRERAHLRGQAIDSCAMCDDEGYVGLTLCDHDPDSAERTKRGIALVRQSIPKPSEVSA